MILVEGAAMRMSKRSEYGLKAAVHLASHHIHAHRTGAKTPIGGVYLQSREIAEAERLPPKFLESVLLSLRSAQILVSKVGAGGGYRLSRGPEHIRVHEVIDALERDEPSDESENGHTPTTLPALPDPHRNGHAARAQPAVAPGTGHAALQLLNQRLDAAVADALGSLTLRELIAMSESASTRA